MNAVYNITRQKILNVAAEEIHMHGFQACSIGQVIKKAGVSKGALYHHFTSKLELGYAVFDEVFAPKLRDEWEPVFMAEYPIQDLTIFLRNLLLDCDNEYVSKGCPLNNLAQEMSPVDEGFRLRINHMMKLWQQGLADALRRGQKNGEVDPEVNVERTAKFMVAFIEGARGLAKNAQETESLAESMYGLIDYLDRLRVIK